MVPDRVGQPSATALYSANPLSDNYSATNSAHCQRCSLASGAAALRVGDRQLPFRVLSSRPGVPGMTKIFPTPRGLVSWNATRTPSKPSQRLQLVLTAWRWLESLFKTASWTKPHPYLAALAV